MNPNQVRLVAEWQRRLVWTFILSIAAVILSIVMVAVAANAGVREPDALLLAPILGLFGAVAIWSMICLIRMLTALEVRTAFLIPGVILMFIPYVSMIALMGFNMWATHWLRKQGLRVGLMGVAPKDIPPPVL